VALVGARCGQEQEVKTPPDTLVVAAPAIPVTLDGEFGGSLESWEAPANYADRPVDFAIKTNPDGIREVDVSKPPVGLLAESYERSPDGLRYTFHLKEGVKSFFGNELTSTDVQWTYERGIALESACLFEISVGSIDQAKPVTIVDDHTFDINLTAPNPVLPLWYAIQPFTCVIYDSTEVKKHATEADPWAKDWLATHTASFGPYHVESITPGQEIVWVRNPNYHGGPPPLAKVIYRQVPEPATRATLLRTGEVDVALALSPRQLGELREVPGVVIDSVAGNLAEIFALNNDVPPLDDPRVRQAIAYAVPVDDIIATVFRAQPGVELAPGYLPASFPGALDSWPYQHNIEKAKELLTQAGVGSFSLKLAFNASKPVEEEIAILIRNGLQEVGIDVALDKLSPAKYQEQYFTRKAEAVLVNDASSIPDGPYSVNLYFHPEGIADWINYDNPEVNRIIEEALAAQDPDTRASLTRQAHEIIVSEAPWAFYLHTGYHFAHRDYVKGFVWQTTNFVRFMFLTKEG